MKSGMIEMSEAHPMNDPDSVLLRHLRRQSEWLRESYQWLIKRWILHEREDEGIRGERGGTDGKPTALDVGCGPGYVMDILGSQLDIRGVDWDWDMVALGHQQDFDVLLGDADHLPFDDDQFEVVYCSFLLMWVRDPDKVVREMVRVAKKWVICFAEPDFGARIDHPKELEGLKNLVIEGVKGGGGDPFIGRKLQQLFTRNGIEPELGIHQGVWGLEALRKESKGEWKWLQMTTGLDEDDLEGYRREWDRALTGGSLFQFNPIFYALGRK